MLGEMVGEFWGKITSERVLPSDRHNPKIETSVQQHGKLLGVEMTDIVTYWSVMRPGGGLYGEANGVQMSEDGDALTYTAQGVGRFTGHGNCGQLSWVFIFPDEFSEVYTSWKCCCYIRIRIG